MNFVFLSHYLNEQTPGFGGTSEFFTEHRSRILQGCSSNSINIKFSNHTGTHVDLPYHFDEAGKKLNDYRAEDWIFRKPFLVKISCTQSELLDLSKIIVPEDCDLLLIKTGFENFRQTEAYWKNNPGLSVNSGIFLRNERPALRCVGFDFISLTAFQHREEGRIAHKAFLASGTGAPIRIIEDMKLSNWTDSIQEIIVSPLLIDNADGVPVTVIGKYK